MKKDFFVLLRRLKPSKTVEEIERKYSNREYNKLSKLEGDSLTEQGYEVVNNWRLLHAEPLDDVTDWLSHTAQHVDDTAIVSKRIKRIASIVPKIQKGYELTQIQDIGGCRAIFSTYEKLLEWLQWAEKTTLFSSVRQVDYIQNPKDSGYRSIHLVCTYNATDPKYNGLKIEIQVRTTVQHTWATALEIIDLYTNQNLKGGFGDENWKRFFKIFSSFQAIKEKLPTVKGTPSVHIQLLQEIFYLEERLGVFVILQGANFSGEIIEQEHVKYEYFILQCRIDGVVITSFDKEHYQSGLDSFLALEKYAKESGEVVALVSAETYKKLKDAYPNYFYDTDKFVASLISAKENYQVIYSGK